MKCEMCYHNHFLKWVKNSICIPDINKIERNCTRDATNDYPSSPHKLIKI